MAKAKSKKETETPDLDFSAVAEGVEASGKRGRPKSFHVSSQAKSIIAQWLDSDAEVLPFKAIDEQIGDDVFGELVDLHDEKSVSNLDEFHENMLKKARGQILAQEAEEVTKSQTKIAKELKDVVDGRAEVRALDYQGQPTFGLVRRNVSATDTEKTA